MLKNDVKGEKRMNRIWQNNYTLRAGDFDCFNRIKPSAVLDLFQDAAGQHAEALGVGFEDMLKRGFLWVVTRVKFEIITAPERYQTVLIKTWPLEPNRINYRREYGIEDLNGNLLIKGSSEWVVLHSTERRFLSVPDLYPFSDNFHDEKAFEGKIGKIRNFEPDSNPYKITPAFCELDINGHVNNIKYADFVLDAVNPQSTDVLKTFQIDYRKEVMQGTSLNVRYLRNEDGIFVKGDNDSGDTAFTCKIELK